MLKFLSGYRGIWGGVVVLQTAYDWFVAVQLTVDKIHNWFVAVQLTVDKVHNWFIAVQLTVDKVHNWFMAVQLAATLRWYSGPIHGSRFVIHWTFEAGPIHGSRFVIHWTFEALASGYTQLLKCVSPGYADAAHRGPAGRYLQWLMERRAEDQRHFHQVQQQCSWSKNAFISEHQVQVTSHPVLCLSLSMSVFRYHLIEERIKSQVTSHPVLCLSVSMSLFSDITWLKYTFISEHQGQVTSHPVLCLSLSVFRYHLIEECIHLWASSPGYFPPCPLSFCLSQFSDISGVSVPVCFQISVDHCCFDWVWFVISVCSYC